VAAVAHVLFEALDFVAASNVAFAGIGEVAAEQGERKRVAFVFLNCLFQLVVVSDLQRA
jgi:hypothetical protein